MKNMFRVLGLLLLFGLIIGCSSPPPEPAGSDVAEEAAAEVEEVPTRVIETEEEEEPEEESNQPEETEMEESEEEMNEPAVDGPTYDPATTVEQAIQERANDQAKGADEPLLTVIEYGDFQ